MSNDDDDPRAEVVKLREQLYVRGEHMREMSDEYVRVLTVALNKHVEVRDELEETKRRLDTADRLLDRIHRVWTLGEPYESAVAATAKETVNE